MVIPLLSLVPDMVGPKAPKQPPSLELYILLAYMGTDCCRFPPIIAPPLPSTCLRLGYSEDYEGANLSCLLLGMYVCRRMKDNQWDVKSIGRVVPTVCVIHLDDRPLPPKQASKQALTSKQQQAASFYYVVHAYQTNSSLRYLRWCVCFRTPGITLPAWV